eukprot:scaffold8792_cov63-Phaeocystis_antarctica.AAC.1
MRTLVLSGLCDGWEVGPRSAAELMEAATHYERAAASPKPRPGAAARQRPCRAHAVEIHAFVQRSSDIPLQVQRWGAQWLH